MTLRFWTEALDEAVTPEETEQATNMLELVAMRADADKKRGGSQKLAVPRRAPAKSSPWPFSHLGLQKADPIVTIVLHRIPRTISARGLAPSL